MERLDPSISKEYLPLILYLEDLSNIVQVLGDAGKSPKISTTEYSFESVAELQKQYGSGDLTALRIESNSPHLSIEMTCMAARLYVGSSQPEAAGLMWKINAILLRCRRRGSWLYSLPGSVGVGALLGSSIPILFLWDALAGLTAVLVWGFWMAWSFRITRRRYCLIILRPRSEVAGFVRRNKDQLVLAIIATVLGAILGVIGTLLTSRIGK